MVMAMVRMKWGFPKNQKKLIYLVAAVNGAMHVKSVKNEL